VPNSDISGDPIEPDAPATLVARFEDGTRRRLTVTSAEAATYRKRGTDETKRRQRFWAFVRPRVWKFVFWAAALVVASLVIPAATKQWSDRQEALALKAALVTDIAQDSSDAYARALGIPLQAHEHGKTPGLALRRKLRTEWLQTAAVIDTRLKTYFDSDSADAWLDYQNAMWEWIALGCCGGQDVDLARLLEVRIYLDLHPPSDRRWREAVEDSNTWDTLRCGPHGEHADCPTGRLSKPDYEAFESSYIATGQALNDRWELLLQRIRDGHVKGFSDGSSDLWRDINPLSD